MQSSWITDEEFGNGYLELKSAPLASKSSAGNSAATHSGSTINISQSEPIGGKVGTLPSQHPESSNSVKDQVLKTKTSDGRLERAESISTVKSDQGHLKLKGGSLVSGSDAQSPMPSAALQSGTSRSMENKKQVNESSNRTSDENMGKAAPKNSSESEVLC